MRGLNRIIPMLNEWYGDAWDRHAATLDWLCITTNFTVIPPKGGDRHRLVMGAGIAGQAERKFEDVDHDWGEVVEKYWPAINSKQPFVHLDARRKLVMFPVKWHWAESANMDLIERSCQALRMYAKARPWENFLLPRPGCGLGNRSWMREVKPVCELFFGDLTNVVIIHYGNP